MIAVLLCTLTVSLNTDEPPEQIDIFQYDNNVEYSQQEKILGLFPHDDQYSSYSYIFDFDLPKYFYDVFQKIPHDLSNKDLRDENFHLKEENSVLKHYIQSHKEHEVNSLNFMLELMLFLFIPSLFVGFCLSYRHKKKKTPIVIDVEPLEIKKEELVKA